MTVLAVILGIFIIYFVIGFEYLRKVIDEDENSGGLASDYDSIWDIVVKENKFMVIGIILIWPFVWMVNKDD